MHRTIAVVPALAALLLAACGPGAAPSGPPAGTADGAPATAQPRSGGQLNQAVENDPFDWDLTYNGKTQPMYMAMGLAYNSLLGFDASPDVKYNDQVIRPELAERWEVSPDGKTFTYHLRKGVRFANLPPVNGREITSADVKWSFEYQSRTGQFQDKKLPAGTLAFMFEGLDRVDTPDPYTVVVSFKDPFVPFGVYAASNWNPVYPHEVYDQEGSFKNTLIGSGPFILDPAASQQGSRTVFKKNPDYWDSGKPYLDQVRWLLLPEEATQVAAFKTKQIDFMDWNQVDQNARQQIQSSMPDAVITEFEYPAGGWLVINNQAPPMDNVNVRRAVVMAINRDEISQTLFGKKQPWALAGALNGLFTDEEARQILKYDPTEAKRLLAQAGYPNGLDLPWTFSTETNALSKSIQELMQAQLKQAGINVTFQQVTAQDFSSGRRAHKYTIEFLTWACGGSLDDMDTTLYSCFYSTSPYNVHGVSDPALDKVLLSQRAETDPDKRREIFRQAARMIADNAYGGSLFYPRLFEAWQPYLKGFAPHATDRQSFPWEQVWLEK